MPSDTATTDDEFPTIAGNLYARWTLDCLTEIAYAISTDAISRPQLYQSDDIPDDLVPLRMSYGTAPHFPNSTQRQAMMMPILGSSDGFKGAGSQSSFQIARRKFVDACAAFAEQASQIEGSILEDRIRSSAKILRAHFHGIRGKSFLLSEKQIQALFDITVRTLKAPGVTKIFGIGHLEPEWPMDSTDPNGAKLVENLGSALSLSGNNRLTFTDFLLLQRVAQEGSHTIRLLLSGDPLSDKDITSLIGRGYMWGTSLRELPGVTQPVPQSAAMTQFPRAPQRATAQSPQVRTR